MGHHLTDLWVPTWRAGPPQLSQPSSHACPNQSLLGFNFPLQQNPPLVKLCSVLVCGQTCWTLVCCCRHVNVDHIFSQPAQHKQISHTASNTTNLKKKKTHDSKQPMLRTPRTSIGQKKNNETFNATRTVQMDKEERKKKETPHQTMTRSVGSSMRDQCQQKTHIRRSHEASIFRRSAGNKHWTNVFDVNNAAIHHMARWATASLQTIMPHLSGTEPVGTDSRSSTKPIACQTLRGVGLWPHLQAPSL